MNQTEVTITITTDEEKLRIILEDLCQLADWELPILAPTLLDKARKILSTLASK